MKALGFIETRSLTASIEASDAMTKAADVRVVGTEKIGSGINVIFSFTLAVISTPSALSFWLS